MGHSCRGGMSVVPPVGCPRRDREQMAGPRWLQCRIPGPAGKTQGDVCRRSFAKIDTVQRSGPTFELNSMSQTWNLFTVWKKGMYRACRRQQNRFVNVVMQPTIDCLRWLIRASVYELATSPVGRWISVIPRVGVSRGV